MTKPKVALYVRVSSDDQTVENQIKPLLAYADAQGWDCLPPYVDHAVSGVATRRPAFERLVSDARVPYFQYVLVWKLDRLGRDLSQLLKTIEEFRSCGVNFRSLTEGINVETPIGRMQLAMLGAVAAFERDLISERTKAGMARVKASGKHIGRPRKVRT